MACFPIIALNHVSIRFILNLFCLAAVSCQHLLHIADIISTCDTHTHTRCQWSHVCTLCAYGAATLIHRHLKVRENRRRVFLSVSLSFKLEPDVASTSCYRDGLSLSLLSFLFRHVFAGERVSRWSGEERWRDR